MHDCQTRDMVQLTATKVFRGLAGLCLVIYLANLIDVKLSLAMSGILTNLQQFVLLLLMSLFFAASLVTALSPAERRAFEDEDEEGEVDPA